MLTDLSSDVSTVKNLLFNQLREAKVLFKARVFPFVLDDRGGYAIWHAHNLIVCFIRS